MTRLVAVLGYSDGRMPGLHPVCSARLARAADVATAEDVVLFSGWSRGGASAPEAELMAAAWSGRARKVVTDRGARTTAGNAISIGRGARALGADEVVVVTSRWHSRRAHALVRAALAGTGARIALATSDDAPTRSTQARELVSWSLVPVLALVAARAR